jgi:hypothetical protein
MIQNLVKTAIDSLNEKKLAEGCKNSSEARGITKLQEFLKTNGVAEYEEHIRFLRNLQDLRSKGCAHRKGSDFESQKMYEYFEIGTKMPAKVFRDILDKMVDLMKFLKRVEPRNEADDL